MKNNNNSLNINKIDLHNFNTILSIISHSEFLNKTHFTLPNNSNKTYSLSPSHTLPLSKSNPSLNTLPKTIIIHTTISYSIHFSNPQYNYKTKTIIYTYLNHTLHFQSSTHLQQYQYLIFTPNQLT